MNIQPYRSSFVISVLDPGLARAKQITDDLLNNEYNVQHHLIEASFKDAIHKEPPHILIVTIGEDGFFKNPNEASQALEEWLQLLPELRIILLSSEKYFVQSCDLYPLGIYDCLTYPVRSSWHILKAIDRAAEADYHLYLNEQLRAQQLESSPVDSSFPLFQLWFEQVFRSKNLEQAIDSTMREICRHLGACDAVFFRYLSQKTTLIASQGNGFEPEEIKGVGIDLRASDPGFNELSLRKPSKLIGVKELAEKALGFKKYEAHFIEAGGQPVGVLVLFPRAELRGYFEGDPYVRICVEALCQVARMDRLKQRILKESVFDHQSEALNRQFLIKKLKEEVSRSRRILKPVSLILISIDGFFDFQLAHESRDVDYLVKSLQYIFQKNSRLNDMIGRLAEDQFAVLLPHTDKKGAAIKAERLRRIIETADFSKVLAKNKNVTVTCGVSEYPSLCQDDEDLMKTAEEALIEVKKTSHNRVCLFTERPGFVPDFTVKGS